MEAMDISEAHGSLAGAQGKPPSPPPPLKRKATTTTLAQHTLRSPRWTYLHLSLQSSPPRGASDQLDALTVRKYLTSALQQFLGDTGAAVPIDMLKLEGQDAWIRVPREDGAAVVVAVGGWVGNIKDEGTVGWMVKGRDDWLARLGAGDGMDLFGG